MSGFNYADGEIIGLTNRGNIFRYSFKQRFSTARKDLIDQAQLIDVVDYDVSLRNSNAILMDGNSSITLLS